MIKWLDEITEQIINETSNQEKITCQCGISTTGVAHIGNFRELIITYLVAEQLKQKGKEVRLIMSFDDFDRFKKVPRGVDESYEKFVGMPNYSFPSHVDNTIGYAKYYENKIIEQLESLGIEMECIYQSEKYLKNDYLDFIELVLNERNNIYDIIKKYKTQKLSDRDKEKYYPIKVYCSCCNKDSTTILQYQKDTKKLTYNCTCGFCENSSINKLKIKMKFNVEWPMRWIYESVDFEPCGKGHAEDFGVLNVSKDISKKIYKEKTPIILCYEFLNVKGNKGRMNKNSKDIIQISDVLKVMPREMILYYFLKTEPSKEMTLSLYNDIPKIYEDFENFMNDFNNDDIKKLLKIDYIETLKFSDLIKFLPVANFDIKNLKKYIIFDENEHNLNKIKYVGNWLNLYYNNKYWLMNKTINFEYFNNLSIDRQETLKKFSCLMEKYFMFNSYDEFFNEFKKTNPNINYFYKDFYNMVFNSDTGIPLKRIFENYNLSKIIKLFPKEKKNIITLPTRIIHLSDLYFDIGDDSNILDSKWQKLVQCLKNNNYVDYLLISGDIVCFYNMPQNYNLAYKYLSFLIDELHVSKDKALICTGNHEMLAYNQFSDNYFQNYDKFIKEKLSNYNAFLNKLSNININSSKDLYFIREIADFDIFIINLLFSIVDNRKEFHQDLELIKELLSKYKNNRDNFRLILSHAPYITNRKLFDSTTMTDYFNLNLCGHIHDNDININNNGLINLVSGNKNGLIANDSRYNVYELKDKMLVKKLIYDKKWSQKELGIISKN